MKVTKTSVHRLTIEKGCGCKATREYEDVRYTKPINDAEFFACEKHDKSKVVAALPPVTVTPKPGAVAELLLKTKATEGKGVFSSVTFIRRVETVGGVAPPAPGAAYVGTELRVPYKATYLFYGVKP